MLLISWTCTYVDDVVIKYEPQSARLDYGDVVTPVGAGSTVDHHGHQVVHTVWVDGIIGLKTFYVLVNVAGTHQN